MLSFARINPAGFQSVSSRREFLDERFEFFRGRSVSDGWLFAFEPGSRRIEHCNSLHVGSLAEHLHKFRHVDEPGKAGVETVARAVRSTLHRRDWLTERRGPRIKMMQVVFL